MFLQTKLFWKLPLWLLDCERLNLLPAPNCSINLICSVSPACKSWVSRAGLVHRVSWSCSSCSPEFYVASFFLPRRFPWPKKKSSGVRAKSHTKWKDLDLFSFSPGETRATNLSSFSCFGPWSFRLQTLSSFTFIQYKSALCIKTGPTQVSSLSFPYL